MNDKELLLCPFCGSANVSAGECLTDAGSPGDKCSITQSQCMDCGALGPGSLLADGEVDYGDVKAIAAWNRRHPPAAQGAVPEGWKLVPIEMTEEMERAGVLRMHHESMRTSKRVWRDILAAAPSARQDAPLTCEDQRAAFEAANRNYWGHESSREMEDGKPADRYCDPVAQNGWRMWMLSAEFNKATPADQGSQKITDPLCKNSTCLMHAEPGKEYCVNCEPASGELPGLMALPEADSTTQYRPGATYVDGWNNCRAEALKHIAAMQAKLDGAVAALEHARELFKVINSQSAIDTMDAAITAAKEKKDD